MNDYFTQPSDQRHIFVLFGLGGSGKSEISRKFVELAQKSEPRRCVSGCQENGSVYTSLQLNNLFAIIDSLKSSMLMQLMKEH